MSTVWVLRSWELGYMNRCHRNSQLWIWRSCHPVRHP